MYGFINLPKNLELYFGEEQIKEISQWFDDVSVPYEVSQDGEQIQVITVEDLMKFLSLKKYHIRNFHYPTLMEVMKEVDNIKTPGQKLLTKQDLVNMFSKWVKLPNIKHELNLAFDYGDVFNDDEVRELLRDANFRGDGNVFYRNFVESLFAVAPELRDLKIDYLYKDPLEDPSEFTKPVLAIPKSKSKKTKKPQKSKKRK